MRIEGEVRKRNEVGNGVHDNVEWNNYYSEAKVKEGVEKLLQVGTLSTAFIPMVIPVCGTTTIIGTILWSCKTRFDCKKHYPTLSFAATFSPEGWFFTVGMCVTSCFIFSTLHLYTIRLKYYLVKNSLYNRVIIKATIISNVISSGSLFLLAILDMKNYHDAHIFFTISFFICAWTAIVAVHFTRSIVGKQYACARGSDLQRRRRISYSYCLGRMFLILGITSSVAFGFLFLMVNGVWKNSLAFTPGQEAFAELLAILCQLFFMGTLRREIEIPVSQETKYNIIL